MANEPIHFEASLESSLSPDDLWPFVADTQRINQAIGLPSAHFAFAPRADGGSTPTGTYKKGFFTISRWHEHPFEFIKPLHYQVLREYDVGPFTRVNGGTDLVAHDKGTTVRVWADITPRHLVGELAAKYYVGPQSTSRVLDRCRTYERELLKQRAKEADKGSPALEAHMLVFSGREPEVDQRQLDQRTARLVLAGGDPDIASHLKEHLGHAPDDRVASMRPFELADHWGTERRATLASFLRATTVGLLDLRWDVLCPYCRVAKESVGTLADITGQVHCESCQITVDASFDRLVEVRFRPSTAIREGSDAVFCIGGPQNVPHVVAQTELLAGEARKWELNLPVGEYRLRSPQSGACLIEVSVAAQATAGGPSLEGDRPPNEISVTGTGMTPAVLEVDSGRFTLTLDSQLSAPAVVALEEQTWSDTAATAALVSTMSEFRDLFSSEVLAPGLQVSIERLALLFTDLAGSTAMYERIGQARAFRLVQDHFVVLDAAIREHHGTMIKTIGDAVMAVFPSTIDAAEAAIQMQRGVHSLALGDDIDTLHLLKIGIHSGACLAVTLNEKLDYFGTAVNIAARTEHECQGGEVTVTADAWDDEGVQDLLTAAADHIVPSQAVLKGITEPVQMYHVAGAH